MTVNAHPMIPEFTIGDRLRKARELTGLSREDFADEIGIVRGTVYNYETGATRPKKIALNAWAIRTGVDLDWLASGKVPSDGGPEGDGLSMDTSGYGYPVAA